MNPTVLILSGGGIKGMAHCSCLWVLNEFHLLDSIHTFVGTSIGGLVCALLVLGYSPQECTDLFYQIDFTPLVDEMNIANAFSGTIIQNNWFPELIRHIILKKRKKIPTLKQLYNETKKRLVLNTVCRNSKKEILLHVDSFPSLPLDIAIQMTCCIPGFFPPVQWKGNEYWDGGLKHNYLSFLFPQEWVLGLELKSSDKILFKSSLSDRLIEKQNWFLHTDSAIFQWLECIHFLFVKKWKRKEKYFSVPIDIGNCGTFDFQLTNYDKIQLFFQGIHAALSFLFLKS